MVLSFALVGVLARPAWSMPLNFGSDPEWVERGLAAQQSLAVKLQITPAETTPSALTSRALKESIAGTLAVGAAALYQTFQVAQIEQLIRSIHTRTAQVLNATLGGSSSVHISERVGKIIRDDRLPRGRSLASLIHDPTEKNLQQLAQSLQDYSQSRAARAPEEILLQQARGLNRALWAVFGTLVVWDLASYFVSRHHSVQNHPERMLYSYAALIEFLTLPPREVRKILATSPLLAMYLVDFDKALGRPF